MCPDKELISAYYDGETDGKWSSEIKTHIDECKDCSVEYEKLASISAFLAQDKIPNEEELTNRVYASIERRKSVIYPVSFWRRHIDLSFPAIMAAAAVLAVIFTVLLVNMRQSAQSQALVEEITPEPEPSIQVLSFDEAAAYIFSDDSGFDVLITIPSSDVLSVSGEPQLIREAEYRRGQ